MHYKVVWEIDIYADNPKEAAQTALEIQRDPRSIATVFDVYDGPGVILIKRVDLLLEENNGN